MPLDGHIRRAAESRVAFRRRNNTVVSAAQNDAFAEWVWGAQAQISRRHMSHGLDHVMVRGAPSGGVGCDAAAVAAFSLA